MVRMPDFGDSVDRGADFVEIAGAIRHHIHALPLGSLVVLQRWVLDQLEDARGS